MSALWQWNGDPFDPAAFSANDANRAIGRLRLGRGGGVKNIETLIDEGGDISIGPVGGLTCVAAATDGANCLAMLVRRDGEKLNTLMKRLDQAIGLAWSDDVFTDEVNGPG